MHCDGEWSITVICGEAVNVVHVLPQCSLVVRCHQRRLDFDPVVPKPLAVRLGQEQVVGCHLARDLETFLFGSAHNGDLVTRENVGSGQRTNVGSQSWQSVGGQMFGKTEDKSWQSVGGQMFGKTEDKSWQSVREQMFGKMEDKSWQSVREQMFGKMEDKSWEREEGDQREMKGGRMAGGR